MKRQRRFMLCLAAGVLVLAVSAGAAFGSANGYSAYKKAVMALALEEENYTAHGDLTMTLDGKEVVGLTVDYQQDGTNSVSHSVTTDSNGSSGLWDATVDGTCIWFQDDGTTYRQSQVQRSNTTLLGYDPEDEMQRRLVNFAELAADTVVGELKNNFVQVGKEDGSTLYQVSIAGSQVPSLVNAGLGLFACTLAADQSQVYQVTYEDYDATTFAYYEKQTGEALSEDFKTNYTETTDDAWYEENQDQLDRFYEVIGGCMDQYDAILEQKGSGIVYVHADGTYDYYATMKDYTKANPHSNWSDDLYYYVGKDMVLNNVDCAFGVDANGYLTGNQITVTFTTTDMDGGHHELVMTGDLTVTDHGTTVAKLPDVGQRTKLD